MPRRENGCAGGDRRRIGVEMNKRILLILTGVVVLATGVFFFRSRGLTVDELAAQSVFPGARRIQTGSYRTFIAEKGTGSPLILVHGFASSSYTWHAVVEKLSQSFRVIVIDMKGFGASDRPEGDYNRNAFAEQIKSTMDALNIRQAHLAGNSMGGKAVLTFALKYPDRTQRLALIDASAYPRDTSDGRPFVLRLLRVPGVARSMSALLTEGRVRSYLETAYFSPSAVTQETVETYHRNLTAQDAFRAPLELAGIQATDFPSPEEIQTLKTKTLILWGREDGWIPVANAERLHNDIKGADLFILPDCGHVPQEEKPDLTASILESFFKR